MFVNLVDLECLVGSLAEIGIESVSTQKLWWWPRNKASFKWSY